MQCKALKRENIKHTTITLNLNYPINTKITTKMYTNTTYLTYSNTQQNLKQKYNSARPANFARSAEIQVRVKHLNYLKHTLHTILWYTYYTHALNT